MSKGTNGLVIKDGTVVGWKPEVCGEELIIPSGVTAISDGAFEADAEPGYKYKTRKIVIPDGVRSIGAEAFSGNYAEEIIIPDSVETIGERAFFGSGIVGVNLPRGLKSMAVGLFSHSSLRSLVIPPCVENIGSDVFYSCKGLEKVFIPKSVKTISEYAFLNCNLDLRLFVEDEPRDGWVEKKEIVKKIGEIVTDEDDAFNFHRSSGGFTSHSYEYEAEEITAWYTDGHNHKFEVFIHASLEQYKQA